MPESFLGRWKITVTGKDANYNQRFKISGSDLGSGTHPGRVGYSVIVDGRNQYWQIEIEHNDGSVWSDSLIRRVGRIVNGTSLQWTIESEDTPNTDPKDWNDLVLRIEIEGPIIEVPIRPYAIETKSLQMMPDGIFESALGHYFMGVRVTNIWGEPFKSGQYIEITPESRQLLFVQGIRIIDAWSQSELQSFNQQLNGNGVVIGPLSPFASTIVYFKVDCVGSMPQKPLVEFICLEPNPMPDPNAFTRKASHKIYVTRSSINPTTHEMTIAAPEGKLRMVLKSAIVDTITGRRGRKPRPLPSPQISTPKIDEIKSVVKELLEGRQIDPCKLHKLLQCYCDCKDLDISVDPTKPRDGRFEYDPFLVLPVKFTYNVQSPPYEGKYGPLPFQDPWWKVLLLVLAVVLLVLAMISEAADLAYQDEDLIIGSLEDWQQHDIDAAITRLNGRRGFPTPFLQYLDAQAGEVSTVPIEPIGAPSLGGSVAVPGQIMSKQEILDILNHGTRDDKRVFKSGARTGLTLALIDDLDSWSQPRPDDGTRFTIDQVRFVRDPDNDMPTNKSGDSGSVWIHKNTLKLVALHHSGSDDDSGNEGWGSLIEDVVTRLGIRFT